MNDFTKEELQQLSFAIHAYPHFDDDHIYNGLRKKIHSMIDNYAHDNVWIDVKYELPKKLKKVLFHWICPAGGNRNISMGYLCDEGWDIYLPYHSFKMHNERLKVTHWRELPKFPED